MGSNPISRTKWQKKPCFMGFFVVIRAIFDNFLRINITINIK